MEKIDVLHRISEDYTTLPQACMDQMYERCQMVNLSKKEVLVKEGQIANQLFYIVSGSARAYYLKDGHDISDWFAFENQFICPIRCFFNGLPSEHYIESIESSQILCLDQATVLTLSEEYWEFDRMGKMIITETMLYLQKRIVSIQFESAANRYLNLLKERSDIELRVPLKHIASYLGITLETLSRIRSQNLI